MGNSGSGKNSTTKRVAFLTEKDIQLLMSSTGLSREKVLQIYNQFLKEYPDGFVDKLGFDKLFRNAYPQGSPELYANFAFKAFDQNGKYSILIF
jgi:Ca2+-binding EF-hand superfamily protein